MTTKAERLAALDRRFDSPENRVEGSLRLPDYLRIRAQIEAMPDEPPKAKPAAPKAGTARSVTMEKLRAVLTPVVKTMAAEVQRLERRITELEAAGTGTSARSLRSGRARVYLRGKKRKWTGR